MASADARFAGRMPAELDRVDLSAELAFSRRVRVDRDSEPAIRVGKTCLKSPLVIIAEQLMNYRNQSQNGQNGPILSGIAILPCFPKESIVRVI
jgi:hypothetical protein